MKRLLSLISAALLSVVLCTVAWASPLTGDNGVGAWVALMVVAVIILVGVIILMAKRNR